MLAGLAPRGAAAHEGSGTSAEAQADESGKELSPFRGSTLTYEHLASAISADKSAELSYVPFYEQRLSIRPEYHYGKNLYGRARLDLEQEFTNADETRQKHEVMVGDLWVWLGASKIELPFLGLKGGADVFLTIPTSKASQAATMIMGVGPGLSLSRKFDVLNGLDVGVGARMNFYFNRYTTTQLEGPFVPCVSVDAAQCGRFVQDGERNAKNMLSVGPTIELAILEDLTVSAFYTIRRYGLYPIQQGTVSTQLGSASTSDIGGDVDARYLQLFVADVTYDLTKELSVSVGTFNLYPSLNPSSQYYTPLFNRFSQIYLDLTLHMDAVLDRIL
jgi:hypothetical protein